MSLYYIIVTGTILYAYITMNPPPKPPYEVVEVIPPTF